MFTPVREALGVDVPGDSAPGESTLGDSVPDGERAMHAPEAMDDEPGSAPEEMSTEE